MGHLLQHIRKAYNPMSFLVAEVGKIPGIRILGATSKAPGCNRKHHGVWSIFSRESQPKPSFVTGILGGGLTKGSMKSLRRLDMICFLISTWWQFTSLISSCFKFSGCWFAVFFEPLLFEINKGWNEKSDMKDLYKQGFYFCHFHVHQNNFTTTKKPWKMQRLTLGMSDS